MNFIFISPNFPTNYYHFIHSLVNNGVTVFGIGDCQYDQLNDSLKKDLKEYYRVDNMNDYAQMYKAVAYFAYHYGPIDWLESNNEYWLENDARLREDFNIKTGNHTQQVQGLRYKSKMKAFYEKAGVKTARYQLVDTPENAIKFIKKVGYPIIIKPDNGMGASGTHKIKNNKDLTDYFQYWYDKDEPTIMEEFIDGELVSFDGVCNSKKEIVYSTAHCYPTPIMTVLNEQSDFFFYSYPQVDAALAKAGNAVVKAFDCASHFFHLEFFILKKDKPDLGKKGDILGLEVNMRPPGGLAPDLFNYAADIDIYQIWADMVTKDNTDIQPINPRYCACYCARRYRHTYKKTIGIIQAKYRNEIVNTIEVDPGLSDCMGDYAFIARFDTIEQARKFIEDTVEVKIPC